MKHFLQWTLLSALASTSFAQGEYDFVQLTGQDGVGLVSAIGISESGTVAGSTSTPNGLRPAIWSMSTGLQVLPGFNQPAVATGVNSSGQVVGSFVASNGGATQAWLFDNGTITTFNTVGNDPVTASVGVTEDGRALVESGFEDSAPDDTLLAVAFLADANSSSAIIPVNASSISPGGFIAAFTRVVDTNLQILDLGTLPVGTPSALGVNDLGIAVGSNRVSGGGFGVDIFPHYWDENQQPVPLPVPNAFENSTGFDINNLNEVVGRADNQAFLLPIGGSLTILADVTDGVPMGMRLREATHINDAGQVLGQFDDGQFGAEGTFLLNPTDGGNDDLGTPFCMAAPNSVGSGAVLTAAGSSSVSAGDLRLIVSQVPDQFGVFFFSPNQQANPMPFGNGFLCVTGPITRINPAVLVSGGSVEVTPDLSVLGISAGQTQNFQFWYRDPADGGAAFNLSQGLSVTFQG